MAESLWLRELRCLADQRPLRGREALLVRGSMCPIGSIERDLAQTLALAGLPVAEAVRDAVTDWVIEPANSGDLNQSLNLIAIWLHAHGLASAWRNELLRVGDASGASVGLIERAAVRPLGIATQAVHLVGWAEQGGLWVQQRAFDKATDPGQWDTLMGGLVSADETLATALERETWEEAGLHIAALRELTDSGSFTVRRPVRSGYMVEQIHVREALVPAGLAPVNQDGEVAAFERIGVDALMARLRAGAFTLEAALILADCLARRGPVR